VAEARRVELPGSDRTPRAGAVAVGPSDARERVEVTVHLRPSAPLPDIAADPDAQLTRGALGRRHGATPEDVAAVEDFARANALDVVAARPAERAVVLGGSVRALGRAFGVELERYEHAGGAYRGRVGPLHLPPRLAGTVEGVFGLDDRPQTTPHFRRRAVHREGRGGFTPPQVAHLYDFPRHLDGGGQTIALLEVSGGYRRADLDAYFAGLGLRVPRLSNVAVDSGRNSPLGDPSSDDSEVLLDIEVAGALAPGARLAVYWTPNTERGFIDAATRLVHDTTRRPTVLSISWGAAESTWTRQAMHVLDGIFLSAAAVGVTVLAASGDDGSRDGVHDGRAHVDFPASSPHVLACGGTKLHLHRDGRLASESAWSDSGGGHSRVFPSPRWQRSRRGRGVPDVAADADPDTGYTVRVDGEDQVLGGTSAAAPLWAALVARANQHRGRPLGLLAPRLYGSARDALRDVTQGSNGAYTATVGWDACTGLGTPRATALVDTVAH
jgi:kumamolisin